MLTRINSPFIDSKLTILRNKNTNNNLFKKTMNDISYLIAAEVLKFVPFSNCSVQTPLKKTKGKKLTKNIVLVPILRAGLGLTEGFEKLLPQVKIGHIGLYRDEKTYKPFKYLYKMPKLKNKFVIILDPMLATGNSSSEAVSLVLKSGAKIKDVFLVSLLSAPEGIRQIKKNHKYLRIFTTSVDKKLNEKKFIVPGLGDAGDRYTGT
ncbi:MAG: Uracil phosphoribosyltransferase [Alphaproteobacteria bacterium MarineAlpha5_Bin11]|nr:uracil phosphoribosyltransferase [Pelagibacteraceae bacterium]PPR44856.1 MAG: Uracil phosphoribosyltransferase [Alphaproteobacteria bacterium MarineAlpha5_Bin11]PPR51812.1 MAG: Uracil phosphoribosyltransferase [Alphaproteobacteria bacterium MarineAlpha5_Bin10]|tara:strand:+ start:19914 stop:20534 length:621 start_codon:yes stop_codon:yes gene_type:complete